MINWLQIIKDNQLNNLLFEGRFGLEKENIRVDTNGKMATTPHPNGFAEKSKHPFITTDFAECQVELITPICKSTLEARQFIETLQDIVHQELQNEYLWPYSQPPILPDDEHLIPIAQFQNRSATEYRTYLAKKYGKHLHLVSGVHFNFSFQPKFLKTLYQLSDSRQSWTDFKNEVYFKIARFFIKHSWLMSYLFGFGDLIHQTYRDQRNLNHYENFGNDAAINKAGFGFRNGQYGYQNTNKFNISFENLEQHLLDLNQAISKGHLLEVREFYSPLRVKGKNKSYSQKTLSYGIEYLEIRNIDLNPFEESGISQDTLDFIHLFLIYGLLSENTSLSHEDYALSHQNSLICAEQGRLPETKLFMNTKQTINIHQWANQLLNHMKQLFAGLNLKPYQLACLNQPQVPLSLLIEQIEHQGYTQPFLKKAHENHKQSLSRAYQLKHYEDLELSSQILLREAIKQGVEFDFLDRKDNFIEFKKGHTIQYVKQATKTKLDNYIAFLAMENKIVSKKLLNKKHLATAKGKDFSDKNEALGHYHQLKNHSIVIKPNSTNFGDGITILNQNFSYDTFKNALEFAFQFDDQILIEHFFSGKEYRFLVIDDETTAVLHRDAANVVGDGQSSIEQLVLEKNKHPMRGEGYRKPLKKIHLGDIERQFLAQQHLDIHSIPAKNKKIYLRKNSNISTGGDSIDFTDEVLDIYKQIAVEASQSVGAFICGVDMIIKDLKATNPQGNYCIIELNFNPAIYFHTYPLHGIDRKIPLKLLKALKLLERN